MHAIFEWLANLSPAELLISKTKISARGLRERTMSLAVNSPNVKQYGVQKLSFFNDFLDVQSKLFDKKARKLLWQLQQKVAFTAYTISNMDPG